MNWSSLFHFSEAEWIAIRLSLKVAMWAVGTSLPFGVLLVAGAGAETILGPGTAGCVHPSAADFAAGGDRLRSAPAFRKDMGRLAALLWKLLGFTFAFRWTGAALASAVVAFPLMVRAIRLSIEAVDRKLEDAAATLGASPPWVFATVTLPLILPGIMAGAILPSRAASVNSARPLPSSPIFRERRRRCPRRSIPSHRFRAAMRARSG